MFQDRRAILSAIGLALPFGFPLRASAATFPVPRLRLRTFEEALREAFQSEVVDPSTHDSHASCRRVEVGYCEGIQAGIQGCINDRPFAGFSARQLRIIRTGSGPGPTVSGVRLYVSTVDVLVVSSTKGETGRSLDFGSLPPAPYLESIRSEGTASRLI